MRLLPVGFCVLAFAGASALAQAGAAPAYLVAEFTVTDSAASKAWGEKASAVVKAHGGTFIATRAKPFAVVGDPPEYATIVRFESMEKARAYMDSAENKALAPERDKSGKFRTYIVEGAGSP